MTTPPLDLPVLRERCVKALDAWTKGPTPPYLVFDASDVLALLDRVEAAESVIRHVRAARDEFDKNGSLAFLQMELDRALDGTP